MINPLDRSDGHFVNLKKQLLVLCVLIEGFLAENHLDFFPSINDLISVEV